MTDLATPASPASPNGEAAIGDEGAPAPATRKRRSLLDVTGPLLVFAAFLGAWNLLSYGLFPLLGLPDQKQFLLPPPHEVVRESFTQWEPQPNRGLAPLLSKLWISTQLAFVGLAIATGLGMVIGILMSQARWIERSSWPYLVALQSIPILAVAPLIGNVVNFDFGGKLIVTVVIALFPVVANTLFGIKSVDRSLHELFDLHGTSRWTRLIKLELPIAAPAIFEGFRISAGLAVIGAVVGDLTMGEGEGGIGQLIQVYRQRLRNPEMIGAIVLAALLGLAFFWAFGFLKRRAVGHWYDAERPR
ncbi:MAG: ABC transporter permease [Acidimicrobiales bacterium]